MIEFSESVDVDQFNFTTGNDEPGRDPVSWRLEASQDNASWTLLHSVSKFATPTSRRTRTEWFTTLLPQDVEEEEGNCMEDEAEEEAGARTSFRYFRF